MFGCASAATACASRSKRAGSASGARILTATFRPSSTSYAAHTSAIPPTPTRSSRRYRPPITSRPTRLAYARTSGNHSLMADLLSIDEAQRLILDRVRPLPAETVPLEDARRRVLAESARATIDLPPFASSAMDGFAVRAQDTPAELAVVDRVAAGRPSSRRVGAGEAIGIATGGVVPEGADAVIPVEYVVEHDNDVVVSEPVPTGANVRPVGGDLRAG